MKYLRNNYWLFILILFTLLRLLIACYIPVYYLEGYIYDDNLMVTLSNNINKGIYLGSYNDKTLVKGIFFPLLLSFFKSINMPVSIGICLLYILSCIIFCLSIKGLIKNKYICILYILLIFNPISFSAETSQRIYRYIIGPSQMLLFLSCTYLVYKNLKNKKLIIYLILLGLTTLMITLTREDYLYIYILLLILGIVSIYKIKWAIFIPLIIVYTGRLVMKEINYKYYGVKYINELQESNFSKMYINILSIKPEKYIYRVSIPKSTINKIYEVSPTFKKLKPDLDNLYKNNIELENVEIIDGYLFWQIRSIAYDRGYTKTAKDADKFYGQINSEIKKAFKEGKLKKRLTLRNMYLSPPTTYNIKKFIYKIPKTIKYILTYDEVMTFDYESLSTSNNILITEKTEYLPLLIRTLDTANISKLSYKGIGGICNIITYIYKYLSIIINILGLISFIILIKKHNKLFMPTQIFICILSLILGITYTDVSAFKAIRYFYLAPVYPLFIAFSFISIIIYYEGVKYDHNINALFKRRGKHQIYY